MADEQCYIVDITRGYRRILCFYQINIRVSAITEIVSITVFVVCKAIATTERIIAYTCDAISNSNARKAGATIERILADTFDAIGDSYTLKS